MLQARLRQPVEARRRGRSNAIQPCQLAGARLWSYERVAQKQAGGRPGGRAGETSHSPRHLRGLGRTDAGKPDQDWHTHSSHRLLDGESIRPRDAWTPRRTRRTADIVRHIMALIIAMTFCADRPTAQSMSRHDVFGHYQQVNWQERDGLPQNTVVAHRDDARRLSLDGNLRRRGPLRWCPLHALQSEQHHRDRQFVSDVAARAARRRSLAGEPMAAACRASPAGRFTQYAMRDGLSSDFTTCLFEDQAGTLWIGTDGGGVNAFSRGRLHAVHPRRWPAEQSRASHHRRWERWAAGRHEPGHCQDCRRSRAAPMKGARTWRTPTSARWPGRRMDHSGWRR